MSEIVKELAFNRLYQLAKAAGSEGFVVIADHGSPTSLTEGQEYRVKVGSDDTMYFVDDSDIPIWLIYPEDIQRFKPFVDASEFVAKIADQRGRVEHRVKELVEELAKLPLEEPGFKPGDIVAFVDGFTGGEDKPYIVAKLLSRDEMRLAAQIAETLVAHDLLVYHLHGEVTVSILASHRVKKIGSLEEWGMEPLDPRLVEKLTVFDSIR